MKYYGKSRQGRLLKCRVKSAKELILVLYMILKVRSNYDKFGIKKFYVLHCSDAVEYKLKEGHVEQLKIMIQEAYGGTVKNKKYTSYQKKDLKTILQWVLECVQYSDIITLIDIRR